MAKLVDLYKLLEKEKMLFHTKLEKLGFENGKLFLKISPLARKFLTEGDTVSVGYASFIVPGRVVGKSQHLVVRVNYLGEKGLADRSKPRVPILEEGLFLLLKVDKIYRSLRLSDLSEGGFSAVTSDHSLVERLIDKVVEFKMTGLEELSGVYGSARLVGVLENQESLRLSFEMEVDDASATKVRLYVVKTMWRLLGDG